MNYSKASGVQAQRALSSSAFCTTLDRRYIHKFCNSQVYLTHCEETKKSDVYKIFAQLPRWHHFYRPTFGLHDSMPFMEIMRQSSIYIAHMQLHVPLTSHFIMKSIEYLEYAALSVDGVPSQIYALAKVSRKKYHASSLISFQIRFEIFDFNTDALICSTGGDCAIASAERYASIRDGSSHIEVGQNYADTNTTYPRQDIVSAFGPDCWKLIVDRSHPVFFDHPSDHVPGMLMLEAIRQACDNTLRGPSRLASMSAEFLQFGELDEELFVKVLPTTTTAEPLVFAAQICSTTSLKVRSTVKLCRYSLSGLSR